MTLILDHINGHNNDDRLENLRWVCPNCNQQLDTTCRGAMDAPRNHITLSGVSAIAEVKKYYCKVCGKEITANAKTGMCAECCSKSKRFCERPSREELKSMIRTLTFTAIAKKYGVSDKAIVKWCDAENLPSRKKDINTYSDEEWKLI